MNIYSAEQIKSWDEYTITHEPIASIDLMERAARTCTDWIIAKHFASAGYKIFCGKGNNGGDGLAIARLLTEKGLSVQVYILESGKMESPDFKINLQRLQQTSCTPHFIQSGKDFPAMEQEEIIIDALFGTGLNKVLDGLTPSLIHHINHSNATVIAIDLPSGLYMDRSSVGQAVIQARYTLTFQTYKLALLVAENAPFFGQVEVLNIGLHLQFFKEQLPTQYLTDKYSIKTIYKPRTEFGHKGTYGHALIIAGSYGKIGAALLATAACLKSGAGLVTAYIPQCGYDILQTSAPEAMALTDGEDQFISSLPPGTEKYSAIGIGPGIGTHRHTLAALKDLIAICKKPLVIDADGLNNLSLQPGLLPQLPVNTILTPHPKEFGRLFGPSADDFARIQLAVQKAQELRIIIVLKGHHTLVALPNGHQYFNSTGNSGMATGGSGDVLTGIITSLLAQNYTPEQAAILGVYLHGLAGDFASGEFSKEAMVASDIIASLSRAFIYMNE